jgi:MerR family transcriptional regulator, repressor of the yfmOP operon
MTALVDAAAGHLRVGEVAEQTGTTPRTIRYYEEIGLLAAHDDRPKGVHRLYTAQDVERVREVMRLRDLLGLSLEQLSALVEVESVRRHLKDEWAGATEAADQRRILLAALQCARTQLELVQRRQDQLVELEAEVRERKGAIEKRLRGLASRTE